MKGMIDWITALIIIVIVTAIIISLFYLFTTNALPNYLLGFDSVLKLPI